MRALPSVARRFFTEKNAVFIAIGKTLTDNPIRICAPRRPGGQAGARGAARMGGEKHSTGEVDGPQRG
jgi:hypothetical protein